MNASPICRMAASAIPVPPMRNGTGSSAVTWRGDAIAIETAKAATPAKVSRRDTDPAGITRSALWAISIMRTLQAKIE